MKSTMFPSQSTRNGSNTVFCDAIFSGDGSSGFTFIETRANNNHVRFGENVVAAPFSKRKVPSVFGDAIQHVIPLTSKKQVVRSNAHSVSTIPGSIVAFVKNAQPFWNRSMM